MSPETVPSSVDIFSRNAQTLLNVAAHSYREFWQQDVDVRAKTCRDYIEKYKSIGLIRNNGELAGEIGKTRPAIDELVNYDEKLNWSRGKEDTLSLVESKLQIPRPSRLEVLNGKRQYCVHDLMLEVGKIRRANGYPKALQGLFSEVDEASLQFLPSTSGLLEDYEAFRDRVDTIQKETSLTEEQAIAISDVLCFQETLDGHIERLSETADQLGMGTQLKQLTSECFVIKKGLQFAAQKSTAQKSIKNESQRQKFLWDSFTSVISRTLSNPPNIDHVFENYPVEKFLLLPDFQLKHVSIGSVLYASEAGQEILKGLIQQRAEQL